MGRNFWIALFCLAHFAAVVQGLNLTCTNDFNNTISCELDGENCWEYTLDVRSDNSTDEQSCSLQRCKAGRCCCSVEMMTILGNSHTATPWRNGTRMEPKTFCVMESMKPKTPTIVSVNGSNKNFEVLWNTNMEGIAQQSLTGEVTYYKASDTKKEQVHVEKAQQITVSGYSYYKILGQHLEPSTSYVVSVRSITNWGGLKSDSSNEFEFKTSASSDSLLLAIIISLSIAAVLLCGAIYVCYDKLKSKWWDPAKYSNPKLDIIHSIKQEVFRPMPDIIFPISVSPVTEDSDQWSKVSLLGSSGGSGGIQHRSGTSTGSSNLSYANAEPVNISLCVQNELGKIFPNIGLMPNEMSCGSSDIENQTYAIALPHQSEEASPEVSMQTEMICEPLNRSNENDVLDNYEQWAPPAPTFLEMISPSGGSSFVETDMSYHPCSQDSATVSEDSNSSSFCSGANTCTSSGLRSGDGTGCGSVGEVVGDAAKPKSINEVIANTACSSFAFAESQGGLLVDDDYQDFQGLVGQLDVSLLDPPCLQPKEPLDQQKSC